MDAGEYKRDYTTPQAGEVNAAAEAQDAPPVASGVDGTPTNWFEFALELCAEGRISETRYRRAVEAVRQGVDRA